MKNFTHLVVLAREARRKNWKDFMANWHRVGAWDDGTRGSRDRRGQKKATPLGTVALAAVIGTLALFSAGQANAAGPPCFGSPGTIFACDVFLALEEASVNDIGASTSPVLFIGVDNVVPSADEREIARHYTRAMTTLAKNPKRAQAELQPTAV